MRVGSQPDSGLEQYRKHALLEQVRMEVLVVRERREDCTRFALHVRICTPVETLRFQSTRRRVVMCTSVSMCAFSVHVREEVRFQRDEDGSRLALHVRVCAPAQTLRFECARP